MFSPSTSSVSSSDTPRKLKKCWQTASRQHLYLHLILGKKKHPATFFSTLCLSRSLGKFCSVVNGTLVLITWSRGTLWPRSSLLQLCSLSQCLIFFVSWCVHVLQFCLFYCILKSLIIIPSIDYILVMNVFTFDLCNEEQSNVYWFVRVEEIFITWPVISVWKKKVLFVGSLG